ncbi:conserved hypothetical protein [Treponema primitia ZAS-2]|uniref:Uncharacterized protein n=1 Tax=Treponema primitia (strain ATCC BAA-887 / DSM 12427 / ZAS-2) TaxID=545694 RepID=F5YJZ2_TREPZ|nr:conserved hypothetical protein [Treponema primitia ZAS-2]
MGIVGHIRSFWPPVYQLRAPLFTPQIRYKIQSIVGLSFSDSHYSTITPACR